MNTKEIFPGEFMFVPNVFEFFLTSSSYRKVGSIMSLVRMRNSSATLGLTWRVFSSLTVFLMGRGVSHKEDASVSLFNERKRNLAI